MTLMDRVDATLAEADRLLTPREPRPFRLRKVWPPDELAVCGFPWRLDGPPGWGGATRFRAAEYAYEAIAFWAGGTP